MPGAVLSLGPSLRARNFQAKGVCRAGAMKGLEDDRTGLIGEVFKVLDQCPRARQAEAIGVLASIAFALRCCVALSC